MAWLAGATEQIGDHQQDQETGDHQWDQEIGDHRRVQLHRWVQQIGLHRRVQQIGLHRWVHRWDQADEVVMRVRGKCLSINHCIFLSTWLTWSEDLDSQSLIPT